jgi:hypothetical protein
MSCHVRHGRQRHPPRLARGISDSLLEPCTQSRGRGLHPGPSAAAHDGNWEDLPSEGKSISITVETLGTKSMKGRYSHSKHFAPSYLPWPLMPHQGNLCTVSAPTTLQPLDVHDPQFVFIVFCFSASLPPLAALTNNPFLLLTPSTYRFATFSLSPCTPKSSSSSSLRGTQFGSTFVPSGSPNPVKRNCGCASPEVRLRISSVKPKLSATGSEAWIVK